MTCRRPDLKEPGRGPASALSVSGPRRSGPLAFAQGGGGAVAAGLRLVPRQPTRGPMCRVPLSAKLGGRLKWLRCLHSLCALSAR